MLNSVSVKYAFGENFAIVHVFLTFYAYHKLIDIMRVIEVWLRGLCLCINFFMVGPLACKIYAI